MMQARVGSEAPGPASAYAPHGRRSWPTFAITRPRRSAVIRIAGVTMCRGSTVCAISIAGLKSIDPRGECGFGSIAPVKRSASHFRSTLVNGHSQIGPVRPFRAKGLNRSRGRALRQAAWPWMVDGSVLRDDEGPEVYPQNR